MKKLNSAVWVACQKSQLCYHNHRTQSYTFSGGASTQQQT